MLKSTNITFSWCRQVRVQGTETLPYRQLNSKAILKRWLDPISARRRTIIFLAQTLQRLTRSVRHLSAKKKWPAPWLRRNLVQTLKCKVWGAWTRTLRWRSNSRNSTLWKIPPANVPSLFRKSESLRRSLKRQRMPILSTIQNLRRLLFQWAQLAACKGCSQTKTCQMVSSRVKDIAPTAREL